MKKYIRVYLMLLKLNIQSLFIFRIHFYNSVAASIAWGFFSLFSVVLITSRTSYVFGWKREEVLLMNGIYGIIVGIFHIVFSRNFERFSTVVHKGQLDTILLKPIDSQFLLSFWLFGYATLSRVIIALGYVCYIMSVYHFSVSFFTVIQTIFISISSIILLYSLWYIIITSTIWFTKLQNLADLMFSVTGIARYPQEITRQLADYIFVFILPFTLIITIPTKIILGKYILTDVILLGGLSVVLLFFSRKFWVFALRFYTSASG